MHISHISTVEPPLSRTSIIRLGSFLKNNSENGRVPQTHMRIAAVTMETCLLIFCTCADNHVALLFINKVGGSRRGFIYSIIRHIHLSGLLLEPRCPDNRGSTVLGSYMYIRWCRGIPFDVLVLSVLRVSSPAT